MYIRQILAPGVSPIENGNPVIGTWNSAFEKVDLLEIRRPYGYPQPRWIRNYRIKEWQYFSANDDRFLFEAIFYNLKLYRMIQITFYDIKSKEKFIFRKIKPGTGWQLPKSLANSSVGNHSSNFYFRIHCWLDADTVILDINIESSRRKPSLTVHLAYNLSSQDVIPIAVSLGFTDQRIMYAYKTHAPVRGDIVFKGQRINLKQETCSGFFCDYKGFFPHNMQAIVCNASGFNEENRRFGFHIAENQTWETFRNNENALWLDGKLTPLPPVLITMPNGFDADWIIQDIEGMVDLTFTPIEPSIGRIKRIITKTELNTPLGYYNGMLKNNDGVQIQIKNLFGMGEKFNLRV